MLAARQRTIGLRDAAAGVGMLAALVSPGATNAQQVAAGPTRAASTASFFAPSQKCDEVGTIFKVVEFKGPYRSNAFAWLRNGCKGPVPKPSLGDPYNVNRFNVAVDALSAGKIALNP